MTKTEQNATRILRRPQVEEYVGLSRSSIYRQIDTGDFPRPVPLGPGAVGWLEGEVLAWIECRRAQRDAEQERIAAIQAKFRAGARA